MFYAPFEFVNYDAKINLVGIRSVGIQMNRALNAARKSITNGEDIQDAIRDIMKEGCFSGNMRPNIVNILNRIEFPKTLDSVVIR
jgi:uncharacterized protein with von Willebrand factor type A (vWA) domain